MRVQYIVTFEDNLDKEQLGCALRAIGMIRGVDDIDRKADTNDLKEKADRLVSLCKTFTEETGASPYSELEYDSGNFVPREEYVEWLEALAEAQKSPANTDGTKFPLNCYACSKRFKVPNCGCGFGDLACRAWQLRPGA